MNQNPAPSVHWRSTTGAAMCGQPARAEHIVAEHHAITCSHCEQRWQTAAMQWRGARA